MKCPRCNGERTFLSWLREFTVQYWCEDCHAGFDVDRHALRSIGSLKTPSNGPGGQPSAPVRSTDQR
ncbi:MAG: hypothetical protein IRY83_05775 [Chloroflexi bacterium]|nr:hypothetical protein [Chloroflexota bacterium]